MSPRLNASGRKRCASAVRESRQLRAHAQRIGELGQDQSPDAFPFTQQPQEEVLRVNVGAPEAIGLTARPLESPLDPAGERHGAVRRTAPWRSGTLRPPGARYHKGSLSDDLEQPYPNALR